MHPRRLVNLASSETLCREADPVDGRPYAADSNMLVRLAAIEERLHRIEASLDVLREFKARLNEIHDTLTIIGRYARRWLA